MKKKAFLFILVAAAVMESCKKEDSGTGTIPEPATHIIAESYVVNNANPYDGVGARHNSALDSLLKQNFRARLTRDELFKKNFDFFGREYPGYSYTNFYLPLKGLLDSIHTTDIIATPLERRGMKPRATALISRMLDALSEAPTDAEFVRGAKMIEAEAKAVFLSGSVQDSLSAVQVLTAGAIFRYSAHYWHKNGSAWKKSIKLARPGADTTATFGSVAKEDGKGAVAGAVGGAVAGPKGAIAGGLLGGIGSSLAAWLFD